MIRIDRERTLERFDRGVHLADRFMQQCHAPLHVRIEHIARRFRTVRETQLVIRRQLDFERCHDLA